MSREFICEECQNSTLNKLETMLEILQTDTKQGTVTPTEIADNILNIMGKKEFTFCISRADSHSIMLVDCCVEGLCTWSKFLRDHK